MASKTEIKVIYEHGIDRIVERKKNERATVHTIPSYIKNITNRFSKKGQRLPLDYDSYLFGRSYQLFKSAIHSEKTLQLYRHHLFHFCDFARITTEGIVSKYGNSNGKNVKDSIKLQQMIENYVIFLE